MVGGASNQYILEAGVPSSKDKCIVFARMSKILKLWLTSRQDSFQGTFSGENKGTMDPGVDIFNH